MGHDFKGSLWSGELFLSVTTFSLSIDGLELFTHPTFVVFHMTKPVKTAMFDSADLIPDEPFSFLEI